MAAWSKTIPNKETWFALRNLKQLKKVFSKSGSVKMTGLFFWVKADSDDMRQGKIRSLSASLDGIFTNFAGATYEKKGDRQAQSKALKAMQGVLGNKDKTVADLAKACNTHYNFVGE